MQTMTATARRREATPARWQQALARAFANGLRLYQDAATGAWVVTSASKPGVCYATDGETCACEAWLAGDPVCQHRALYRYHHGVLAGPAPAPRAEGADLATQLGSALRLLREVRDAASLDAVEHDQLSAAIRRVAAVASALSAA